LEIISSCGGTGREDRGRGVSQEESEGEEGGSGLRGVPIVSGELKESNPSTAACVLVIRQFPNPGVKSLGPSGKDWLEESNESEIQESSRGLLSSTRGRLFLVGVVAAVRFVDFLPRPL
jgi:hypothetical protein